MLISTSLTVFPVVSVVAPSLRLDEVLRSSRMAVNGLASCYPFGR